MVALLNAIHLMDGARCQNCETESLNPKLDCALVSGMKKVRTCFTGRVGGGTDFFGNLLRDGSLE